VKRSPEFARKSFFRESTVSHLRAFVVSHHPDDRTQLRNDATALLIREGRGSLHYERQLRTSRRLVRMLSPRPPGRAELDIELMPRDTHGIGHDQTIIRRLTHPTIMPLL
jgi:hypothetical protein